MILSFFFFLIRYENKGVQWLKSKPSLPPGLDPSLVSSGDTTGMSKSAKKNAKKKEKKKQQQEQSNQSGAPIQNVTHSLASVNLNTDKSGAGKKIDHKADSESSKQVDAVTESQDVTKKLRALKKKLRQIEDIEKRLQSGELKNPEKDQLDKVERKQLVLEEIADLELKLDS